MSGSFIVREAFKQYKENELIFAGKLYREQLSGEIGEAAYYKAIERMCKSGELVKIAKGTYHLPKISKYGIVPPSEKEIVSAFTENNTGTVVGYSLYNALNLSTQISKSVTVMSSALESFSKTIRNVVINQVNLEYSQEITSMLHALEVLQNYSTIQDINYAAFIEFSKKLAENYDERALQEIMVRKKYKTSTIAFLQEILKHYGKENNLGLYLSILSKYKFPKMEGIYEAARIH